MSPLNPSPPRPEFALAPRDRDYGEFQSPFLPGSNIQFAWDSTSLGYLKECPRKYFLTIVEGWRSRSESVHLTFGSHFHKALENYDLHRATGLSHEEAVEVAFMELTEATASWTPDHNKKNKDTLFRSVIWYWEEYKDDPAHTLILSNGKPAVELSFSFDPEIRIDGNDYLVSGHMDRLVEFAGDHFVMDRKTTGGTLGSWYFDQYNPDNQMSLYTLASQVVYSMPVAGVMIDAAQIAVGFTAFSRGITLRSDGQLTEWVNDLEEWLVTARRYAERGVWPMNEKSCNNYGGCVFKGICNKDPSVREVFLKTDFEKRYWNPLETR